MPTETDTTDLIARAPAGERDTFREVAQGHSHEHEPRVRRYRILGSLRNAKDAEDALQETLVSSWHSLGESGRRSSLRTWLYEIATSRYPRNAAPPPGVAALPEPTGVSGVPPWLEPYPDVLLDSLADQAPGPEVRYEATVAISLAFITALQRLPPSQRAVLVLCDVLGYRSGEVAEMLDATRESVHSSLKRARITVDHCLADSGGSGPACRPGTAAEHQLVARLTDALERADIEALVGLLTNDVRLRMPLAMREYRGVDVARRVFTAVTFRPGRSYRVVPTRANGEPAFGMYVADHHTGICRAYGLLVVTVSGDRISVLTGFDASVMPRFGLPRTLQAFRQF